MIPLWFSFLLRDDPLFLKGDIFVIHAHAHANFIDSVSSEGMLTLYFRFLLRDDTFMIQIPLKGWYFYNGCPRSSSGMLTSWFSFLSKGWCLYVSVSSQKDDACMFRFPLKRMMPVCFGFLSKGWCLYVSVSSQKDDACKGWCLYVSVSSQKDDACMFQFPLKRMMPLCFGFMMPLCFSFLFRDVTSQQGQGHARFNV